MLFGFAGTAGVRYVPTSRVSARLFYSYELQLVDGLTPRNLAGASVRASPDLEIGVHNIRLSGRYRPLPRVALALGYDFARVSDGFSGYYDGGIHKLRASAAATDLRQWQVQASTEWSRRAYPFRQPNLTNQVSDTAFELAVDAERPLWRRTGLMLRYQVQHTSARPFGRLYVRHVFLVGLTARAGSSTRN